MVKNGKICGQKSKICDSKEDRKYISSLERWAFLVQKLKITLLFSRINCRSWGKLDFEKIFWEKEWKKYLKIWLRIFENVMTDLKNMQNCVKIWIFHYNLSKYVVNMWKVQNMWNVSKNGKNMWKIFFTYSHRNPVSTDHWPNLISRSRTFWRASYLLFAKNPESVQDRFRVEFQGCDGHDSGVQRSLSKVAFDLPSKF